MSFNFRDIPQFPRAYWNAHFDWEGMEHTLERWQGSGYGGQLNLNPDYQRAHIWTPDQQTAYVEYRLRGGETGTTLTFNCPGWNADYHGPFELLDGKQRLEAVRAFLANKIPAFGHYYEERVKKMLPDSAFFDFRITKIEGRANILNYYLQFNAGGTPHSKAELDRVRELLAKEQS